MKEITMIFKNTILFIAPLGLFVIGTLVNKIEFSILLFVSAAIALKYLIKESIKWW